MKRILLIIATIFIALLFTNCTPIKEGSSTFDDARYEEEEVKYEIEQILFSKSFQSIEPSVEIITNNNKLKILASLGLSEYSSINVNSITKKGSQVNIHVSGIYSKADSRLAVPQVIIELKKSEFKPIENLKFNIVYDDYTPLKIKYSINDVLNKIQSHSKISSKGTPVFNLTRINNNIAWDISYNSIFDKETSNITLANLSAQIDANTGDIINVEKTLISSYIDSGHVLSYVNDDYILYKKVILDNDRPTEQLWIYNSKNDEKVMLYSSNFKISSVQFSPDFQYISVIEVNDSNSDVYIIPLDDKRAYKIFFEDKFNPKTMRWNNKNILYLVENSDDSSIVYSYDIENNEGNMLGRFNKNIEGLIILNNNFLISEKTENEFNRRISLTTDWDKFRLIGHGFNPRFINENMVSFMQRHKEKDLNYLFIYDIQERDIIGEIKENISNYEILPERNIVYVRKNTNMNNYTLVKYSVDDQSSIDIANLIGDRVYYNEDRKLIYLNIVLPFDNEKTEMIYSLDLDKLN